MLRRIRLEAKLSQSGLAAKMGKSQLFISRSELGERRIDFLETVDFCAACNVSVTEFLHSLKDAPSGKGKPERQKRRSPRRMDGEGRLTGS